MPIATSTTAPAIFTAVNASADVATIEEWRWITEHATGDEPVTILQRLGTDDERVVETTWSELDRAVEADHLTCVYVPRLGRPVGARFLDTPVSLGEERNFSEETARAIDQEVRAIVESGHERARKILEARRDVLETIARRLLVDETLERATLEAMVATKAA